MLVKDLGAVTTLLHNLNTFTSPENSAKQLSWGYSHYATKLWCSAKKFHLSDSPLFSTLRSFRPNLSVMIRPLSNSSSTLPRMTTLVFVIAPTLLCKQSLA